MLSNDEVFDRLRGYFEELFEIPRDKVALESRLYEDLDLDSIDAVDLVVKLQELTGRRIKPEAFKSVRTVGDVIKCIEELLADDPTAL
ncbi:MAG: acyl carrier protein [Proteobacteria bacterium]|nr:acyl carrier protein [Pseudomonadota bacterium]